MSSRRVVLRFSESVIMREKRISIIYPRIPFYLGPILMEPIPKRKSLSLGSINFREAFHRFQPLTAADIFPRKGATYPALQLFVAFCRFSALPLFDQPGALPFRICDFLSEVFTGPNFGALPQELIDFLRPQRS
ncbi:hypothetical protein TSACC_22303 [Terrimicrobium sacchariphilum]|uniref:Uncharacterized protein n=1 Tax=Terrimicrobium sacchariphilum TaxID=690879 RepID=A0A146G9B9_TERSA|nr:hypothetical protein TSACC_22303 [Terrimicrobium sacchariphilum]